jgi:hypothetical protein
MCRTSSLRARGFESHPVTLMLLWPSNACTQSIGTPFSSKLTANVSRNRWACPSGISASLNTPLSTRCQSPAALSLFDSPDQKKYCTLIFGAAARIGHEIWRSCARPHSRERAQPTREGERRSGQLVAFDRRPLPPHFRANDLSQNSRAQAHRHAAGPRCLGGEPHRGPSEIAPR